MGKRDSRIVFNNRHVMRHVTQRSSLLLTTVIRGKAETGNDRKTLTEERPQNGTNCAKGMGKNRADSLQLSWLCSS